MSDETESKLDVAKAAFMKLLGHLLPYDKEGNMSFGVQTVLDAMDVIDPGWRERKVGEE